MELRVNAIPPGGVGASPGRDSPSVPSLENVPSRYALASTKMPSSRRAVDLCRDTNRLC